MRFRARGADPDMSGLGRATVAVGAAVLVVGAGLVATKVFGGSSAPPPASLPSSSAVPPARSPGASALPLPKVADTAYPVPPGALFVAPTGFDSNDGTIGAPLATLRKALATVPTGGTVVLRAGTYRESINSVFRRVTIQAYPHEQVWLDGRVPVTGWSAQGGAWVHAGWDPGLCETCFDPRAIMADEPAAGLPDMVFVDGVALQQVTNRSALARGTFYVDVASRALVLGSDPIGHRVVASALAKAMEFSTAGAAGSAVRGIGVIGYASSADPSANAAMVIVTAPDVTFEKDTFAWGASAGLALFARGAVVRGSTFLHNGYRGLVANAADGLLIESSRFASSNEELFVYGVSPVASAAGAKITRSDRVTVRDSVFEDNFATGLWFDESDRGMTVVRNVMRRNLWRGLMVELSTGALVASNLLVENVALGLSVSGSSDVRVWNNTLANNGVAQVGIYEDPRSNGDSAQRSEGLTWDTAAVEFANNVFAAGAVGSAHRVQPGPVLVDSSDANSPKRVGAARMVSAMDSDVYARSSTRRVVNDLAWATLDAPEYVTNYDTVAAFRAATGYETRGIDVEGSATSSLFVDERAGDYRPGTSSPARGAGRALPSDVAAAVGVPSSPVDVGALRWVTG